MFQNSKNQKFHFFKLFKIWIFFSWTVTKIQDGGQDGGTTGSGPGPVLSFYLLTPLRLFYSESGASYKYPDLLTYLLHSFETTALLISTYDAVNIELEHCEVCVSVCKDISWTTQPMTSDITTVEKCDFIYAANDTLEWKD